VLGSLAAIADVYGAWLPQALGHPDVVEKSESGGYQ